MEARQCKTEALVMRTRHLGEADRLITLLTIEKGKVGSVAKGSRKTKSKLAAGVELFIRGEFILHRGRSSLYTIIGQSVKERLVFLREDPEKYAYAEYFAELVDKVLVEGEKNDELYYLLLNAWRALAHTGDCFLMARSFELKLLDSAGYGPQLTECVSCGNKQSSFYSISMGGVLCKPCLKEGHQVVRFPAGSISLARHLRERNFADLNVLRATGDQKEDIFSFTMKLLTYHLEVNRSKALDYIARVHIKNK